MKPPNVILVVMDTARAQSTSINNPSRKTTPWLEHLAAGGIVYERMISCAPWTLPAHVSLFTGTYAATHGVVGFGDELPLDLTTLAEILKEAGYATFAVSNNAWVSSCTNLDRGFDAFLETWLTKRPASAAQMAALATYFLRGTTGRADSGAYLGMRKIARWVGDRQRAKQPFLVFANFAEPHLPYRPPRSFGKHFLGEAWARAKSLPQDWCAFCAGCLPMSSGEFELLQRLYEAEIAYLDDQIGWLVCYLEENDLLDETILIVTSDHGENIGEHALMDHQFSLHETLIHVPLVVRYPSEIPPGKRGSTLVQTVDILPSILDLCRMNGSTASLVDQFEGISLFGSETRSFAIAEYDARGGTGFQRKYPGVFEEKFNADIITLRTDTWKLVRDSRGNLGLYNLTVDPHETRDVYSHHPEIGEKMEQELGDWIEHHSSLNKYSGDLGPDYNSQMVRHLRDLGYL